MNTKNLLAGVITGAWMILAAGCGGSHSAGDDSAPPAPPPPAASQTVGGSLYGLAPSGSLVLQNNGGDGLTLNADGTFTFSSAVAAGSTYSVTVRSQPANQLCTVGNGTGVIADAAVTSVTINCSTLTRVVGGTVFGLDASESLVLQNNSGDNLVVNGNGNFAFATPVAQSGAYNVAVLTQPASQTCTVTDGSGTAGSSDITDVQVICSTNAYTVGGTVSGLSGTVVLQNNGADNLPLASDGAFTFSTPVAQGAAYNATVSTQPATQTCVVTNGSGTMAGSNVTNVSLTCTANTTTLAISVADLALSVTGLTEYGVGGAAASGVARDLTITNTGSDPAFNVLVSLPTWPAGTTANSSGCSGTLAPGDDCTITITPGNTESSDGTNPCSLGTAPIPGVIQATADNANTLSSNAVVLNYGCIYQGGYVYALDDARPTSQSVGGKVAAPSDQAAAFPTGISWSSDSGGSVAYDVIYGTSEISSTISPNPNSGQVFGQTACNGATDGMCNTNNIYEFYQNLGSPISTSSYAAGLCKQTALSGYLDWSLPAICDLGYGGTACGTSGTPTQQNVLSNLVELNIPNLLSGFYWSSTSDSSSPAAAVWGQNFSGGSFQTVFDKNFALGVRCSRALTQ
jgi:hypothetical protein